MSVRCETKFQAAITPFGDVAVTLIKMMGHSGTVPSALLAEDVPAALARLKAAVAAHSNEPLPPPGQRLAERRRRRKRQPRASGIAPDPDAHGRGRGA